MMEEGLIPASEREEELAQAKKYDAATDPEEIADVQDKLEDGQAIMQIVLNIAKIKGDAASPAIKAYVEEMKKLSSGEYNTITGIVQAMCNAQEKIDAQTKSTPKANPFAELCKPKTAPKRLEL
jgi:predicted phage tail protein